MKVLILLLLTLTFAKSENFRHLSSFNDDNRENYNAYHNPFEEEKEFECEDEEAKEKEWEEEPEFYPGNIYLGHQENFKEGFEASEIRNALDFIEFKIRHVQELMLECVKDRFAEDLKATVRQVKEYCVGVSFQILFQNYEEGLRKLKEIITELLRLKFEELPSDFEEAVDFFMDLLDDFTEKDLSLAQSFKISQETSKYFVSPIHYDKLIELAQPEINAFEEVHQRIKEARNNVAQTLQEEAQELGGYVSRLEKQADLIEESQQTAASESEIEPEEEKSEEEEEEEEEEPKEGLDDRDEESEGDEGEDEEEEENGEDNKEDEEDGDENENAAGNKGSQGEKKESGEKVEKEGGGKDEETQKGEITTRRKLKRDKFSKTQKNLNLLEKTKESFDVQKKEPRKTKGKFVATNLEKMKIKAKKSSINLEPKPLKNKPKPKV